LIVLAATQSKERVRDLSVSQIAEVASALRNPHHLHPNCRVIPETLTQAIIVLGNHFSLRLGNREWGVSMSKEEKLLSGLKLKYVH
jgi:hypothetical protein